MDKEDTLVNKLPCVLKKCRLTCDQHCLLLDIM